MLSKFLLPACAVLSVATAQSSSLCSQATATINSQADATQYASCTTMEGSVVIGSGASGLIQFDGPQQIKGDFIASNATAMTSLSSATINAITGTFQLVSLTVLSNLAFSELQSVGSIDFEAIPILGQLTFPASISKATDVLITNTGLNSLDGINLMTARKLNINNNNHLSTFSTQVANITDSLNIEANGRNLEVSFPNLISSGNMTFRNVSALSIPSLASVNGSIGFYGNYFTSLAAPNLTIVGKPSTLNTGSLAFVGNGALTNLSFPGLATVTGAYQIANNTDLTDIEFPSLANVGGALDFSGNFSTPQLPKLKSIAGGFNMQSTAPIDCSGFDKLRGNVIAGVYRCIPGTPDAKSGLGSATSTGSSSSPTSSKKSAAVSYGVNEAVAGLSVMGGLLQLLL